MFCYQCEQTAKGTGCTIQGVCGKDPETAAMQDLLVHAVEGLSMYAHRARQLGVKDHEIDVFAVEALFATLTNVNFDAKRLRDWVHKAVQLRDKAGHLYKEACKKAGRTSEKLAGPAAWDPPADADALLREAENIGIANHKQALGDDVAGLHGLILYGVKGACAYLDHAQILGNQDDAAYGMVHELLDFVAQEPADLNELLKMALRAGELNLKAMELLDAANTGAYGHPTPTPVRIEPIKGKAIVVSGHDLKDLEELLKQSVGKGINVYTHGEMLPAHGYPGLRKYRHLVGNFGGAWQEQIKEFEKFPGAILMTTNCLQRPKDSYKARLFTSGVVGWPGCVHITNRDFTPVINAALAAPGFAENGPHRTIMVGFARNAILGVADKVVAAVKSGAIKRFFLIGGCDGAKPGRNYFTEFAQAVPRNSVILTLACGKFRFNKIDFGNIGGIPRLLDVGQCNDAYSAVQVAVALSKAFHTDINKLPLSFIVSWYEQKAVAILLTLLHLGIRNIRLGPSLPAFITPPVLKVLHEKFNVMPITTVEADMKAILG
jgi:hydroxylamine reductase